MRVAVVQDAEEVVHALQAGPARRVLAPEAPLADDGRAIAGGLQHFRQRDVLRT